MAINFNLQGIVDAMTERMIEAGKPEVLVAKKAVVYELSKSIREAIKYHGDEIKALKTDDAAKNETAIKYHENQLAFYQS